MKIIFTSGKVFIQSSLGEIEGDSLLMYRLANILADEMNKNGGYKESFNGTQRIIYGKIEGEDSND